MTKKKPLLRPVPNNKVGPFYTKWAEVKDELDNCLSVLPAATNGDAKAKEMLVDSLQSAADRSLMWCKSKDRANSTGAIVSDTLFERIIPLVGQRKFHEAEAAIKALMPLVTRFIYSAIKTSEAKYRMPWEDRGTRYEIDSSLRKAEREMNQMVARVLKRLGIKP